jgi:drug/metabolite transporter (DMT)-like permease
MRKYSPLTLNAAVTAVGTIPLIVVAVPQLMRQDWGEPDALAWGAFVYGVFVAHVLTNLIWFAAVPVLGATRAAIYTNLEPFLGALFAVILLAEPLGVFQIVGGIIIGTGIILARRRPRAAAPHPA